MENTTLNVRFVKMTILNFKKTSTALKDSLIYLSDTNNISVNSY